MACVAALWLGLFAFVGPTFAATFTAALERDTMTLGESVGLALTFEGVQPKDPPALPGVANLQIAYNGQASQFQIVNGQSTSSVTHNFTVTPRRAGDYIIPAMTLNAGGQQLTTQPLRLKVLPAGAPPPEAVASGSQPAFLKLVLPKTNVYLGEIITGELQFYFRQGVQLADQPRITDLPAEGLSFGKIVPGSQRQVQIGNAVFNVIPASVALTAIKTGPLNVGPITASVVIQLPSANRQRDVFDPFRMFSRGEQRQLALATDTLTVQSLPLPTENAPANFSGAVGQFSMTVNVGPTNVATGDPITVRVQIAGRGALDALKLPEQVAWHDFKAYPPTAKVETSDPLGLQGTKIFEQIIAPQSTDITELPPFSFSFFDPDAKRYQTLTQPAVKLTVRPGGSTPAPVVAATTKPASDAPPPQQDIVPIKPRLGPVTKLTRPLVAQPWFLAVQGTPVLAFVAAFIWRQRTDSLANNPRLRRQRLVAQIVRDGTQELQQLGAENNSEKFFATLFRLLQEQLGERLDCPASAITEAVIDEKLRPRGVPESTLAQLHELFQSCNLARYAPTRSGEELSALIPRFENVMRDIQGVKL
jgi:hypothetical protein